MSDPLFGEIIDADIVEQALVQTLKDFLPDHLAAQERRRPDVVAELPDAAGGHLPRPREWPVLSEFDSLVETQLPAIIVVSPGAAGRPERLRGGQYRITWRFTVHVEIAGKDERQARRFAAVYLAAIRGALVQNRTLQGAVELCSWAGGDDHGVRPRHPQRAVYGTNFEVTVRDVVNDRLGPSEPSPDPYNPEPFPPAPEEADFIVEADLEETP